MTALTDVILNQLNSLVVVIDKNTQVQYVSPSVSRLLGYEQEQLLGDAWWELTSFYPNGSEDVRAIAQKILADSPGGIAYERQLKTASGGTRWVLWNTSITEDQRLIGIGHDITDRKLAEEQLLESNKLLAERNKDIVESLEYARTIQEAILPTAESVSSVFTDAFVYFKPKDVVSGDFYWTYENEEFKFLAVIDCTGHGVPGAMMTVIANSLLNDILRKRQEFSPSRILGILDEELIAYLNRNNTGEVRADGMDIALVRVSKKDNKIIYAGAFRPLLIVTDNGIQEIRGSRYPIGFFNDVQKIFTENEIQVPSGSWFYIFSDGYIDQFGGERGKKLNRKRFQDLLLTLQDMLGEEKRAFLDYAFLNWKQDEPQTDDVVVAGFCI